MATAADVEEAIAGVLTGRWPQRRIYMDVCPENFERPSFFLYTAEAKAEQANIGLVKWTAKLELKIFCEADGPDAERAETLRLEQAETLALFGRPGIQVGGRHIALTVQSAGAEAGSALIRFTAVWMDEAACWKEQDADRAAMEHYQLNGIGKD